MYKVRSHLFDLRATNIITIKKTRKKKYIQIESKIMTTCTHIYILIQLSSQPGTYIHCSRILTFTTRTTTIRHKKCNTQRGIHVKHTLTHSLCQTHIFQDQQQCIIRITYTFNIYTKKKYKVKKRKTIIVDCDY